MNHQPLVAIRCITYNHGPYIRDALESFVMQRTTFPFVAIVHDDASTDNTAAIIQEYATKYPNIIKPIYETENLYSKHDGSLGRILRNAVEDSGAKYVAMCEGDDYWTDPLKLQKQVDFLESHPDYSMCYSAFQLINYKGDAFEDYRYTHLMQISKSGDQLLNLLRGNYILTCTTCIRQDVFNSTTLKKSAYSLDYDLFIRAAWVGKGKYFSETMACYRVQPNGQIQSNFRNIFRICDDIQRHYIKEWLASKRFEYPLTQRLRTYLDINDVIFSQLKRYIADQDRKTDLLHIIRNNRVLWLFPLKGIWNFCRDSIIWRLRKLKRFKLCKHHLSQ